MTSDVVMTLEIEHFLWFLHITNMQITLKNTFKINLAKCRLIRNNFFFQNTLFLFPSTLGTYQIFRSPTWDLRILLLNLFIICYKVWCHIKKKKTTELFSLGPSKLLLDQLPTDYNYKLWLKYINNYMKVLENDQE